MQKQFTTTLLLLFVPFFMNAQDLQDQLFMHNAKQIAQTKQIPNRDTILLIEQTITNDGTTDRKCADCRMGMNYALSRLFWLSGDNKKSQVYLQKVALYFNQSINFDECNQEVTAKVLREDCTFADKAVMVALNGKINARKGKQAVLFLTGYGLIHQYYLSMLAQNQPAYEHTLVEGASNYEILPLLFELYGQSLSEHEQTIHDELHELAAYLEEAHIKHEQKELLEATAELTSSDFDGACKHMAEYRKMLSSFLKKI